MMHFASVVVAATIMQIGMSAPVQYSGKDTYKIELNGASYWDDGAPAADAFCAKQNRQADIQLVEGHVGLGGLAPVTSSIVFPCR